MLSKKYAWHTASGGAIDGWTNVTVYELAYGLLILVLFEGSSIVLLRFGWLLVALFVLGRGICVQRVV